MSQAQAEQKLWYDRTARHWELKVGDPVLVLLPSPSSKLHAEWQGPYSVKEVVGKVNYVVDMHDKRKCYRTFHINMLHEWHSPCGSEFFHAQDDGPDEILT